MGQTACIRQPPVVPEVIQPPSKPMFRRIVANYVLRHMHPANRALHLVGVPLTFVASVVCVAIGRYWWAAGCFVGGYVLQFIGHAIEGNDAGEVVLVKRWLGKPYREFGPLARHSNSRDSGSAVESDRPKSAG